MSLLDRLLRRKKPEPRPLPQPKEPINDMVEIIEAKPKRSKGGVVRTTPPTWNPDISHKGGRVVKSMPKSLRKLKEDGEARKYE